MRRVGRKKTGTLRRPLTTGSSKKNAQENTKDTTNKRKWKSQNAGNCIPGNSVDGNEKITADKSGGNTKRHAPGRQENEKAKNTVWEDRKTMLKMEIGIWAINAAKPRFDKRRKRRDIIKNLKTQKCK